MDKELFLEHYTDYFTPDAPKAGEIEQQIPTLIQWDFAFRPDSDGPGRQPQLEAFRLVWNWLKSEGLKAGELPVNGYAALEDIPENEKVPAETVAWIAQTFDNLTPLEKGAVFTLYCCVSGGQHFAASLALLKGGITPDEFAHILAAVDFTTDKLTGEITKQDWKEALAEFKGKALEAYQFAEI